MFGTFVCVFAQFMSYYMYDLNQLHCYTHSLRSNEKVCAAVIEGMRKTCIILKKGNLCHCNCVLSCTMKRTLSTVYVSLLFLNKTMLYADGSISFFS